MRTARLAFLIAFWVFAMVPPAMAGTVIIDIGTMGWYNSSIGRLLDGTNPFSTYYLFPPFPYAVDPDYPYTPEPDLSTASSVLGNWLNDPANLNSYWTGPQVIPTTWPVNEETAVVYKIDAGPVGIQALTVWIGVDNGFFMWLNGSFVRGALAPGYYTWDEYFIELGPLAPGTHYLQVLREDHGAVNGFSIRVEAVPEPSILAVVGTGLISLLVLGCKQRRH